MGVEGAVTGTTGLVSLSVRPSMCLSVCLSVRPSAILSVLPSFRVSVSLPVSLSFRVPVSLPFRLSVCLSVCVDVYAYVKVCLCAQSIPHLTFLAAAQPSLPPSLPLQVCAAVGTETLSGGRMRVIGFQGTKNLRVGRRDNSTAPQGASQLAAGCEYRTAS